MDLGLLDIEFPYEDSWTLRPVEDGLELAGYRGSAALPGPDSITNLVSIGSDAFGAACHAKHVTLPEGIRRVSDEAFRASSRIVQIDLPASLESISGRAFGYISGTACGRLESIQVNPENPCFKSEDGVLFSRDGSRLVRYPAGKKGALYRVPSQVRHLESGAFVDCCFLERIELPEQLEDFAFESFLGCRKLTGLAFPDSCVLPPVSPEFIERPYIKHPFSNCESLRFLRFPLNAKTDVGWFEQLAKLPSVRRGQLRLEAVGTPIKQFVHGVKHAALLGFADASARGDLRPEDEWQSYLSYARKQGKRLAIKAVDDEPLLNFLLKYKALSAQAASEAAAYASSQNHLETAARLTEYARMMQPASAQRSLFL